MEVLTEAPKASTFVTLAEHQSATPASFYQGPPVLHYYSDRCKLIILEQELNNAPALANLFSKASAPTTSENTDTLQTNGGSTEHEPRRVVEDVDVWVTSDKLFIYSNPLNTGLSIPYPSISLHAIQSSPSPSATDTSSQGLYMQLVASDGNTTQSEDLEPDSISITIVPTASMPPTAFAPIESRDAELETEAQPELTPVVAMFGALSACSNLHPDPVEDDDMDMDGDGAGDGAEEGGLAGSRLYQSGLVMPGGTDGGLPPPMPGSGGWITAENMHEYFDEQGNWIGPEDAGGEEDDGDGVEAEPLGPGAGTTRQRDGNGVDGEDGEGDETKWRRTD